MSSMALSESRDHVVLDGRIFHNVWLRDHCLCGECRDAESLQKKRDPAQVPARPVYREVIRDGDKIVVHWLETPVHTSTFSLNWLLTQSRARTEKSNARTIAWQPDFAPQLLWNSEVLEKEFPRCDINSAKFEEWSDQLARFGFVVLENLQPEHFDRFVSDIGPIYETEYGKIHPSKAEPQDDIPDLSLSSDGMLVHMDSTFRRAPQLLQFLFAVANEAMGGKSTVVDGFRVADELRRRDRDAFELLSTVPVEFVQLNQAKKYLFVHSTPVFVVDPATSEMQSVYFSDKNTAWSISTDRASDFYKAYRLLVEMLTDPTYCFAFLLKEGDCLITQNFRVLHGREQFDPRSGRRHLDICYMPWDYVVARRRFGQFGEQFRGAA
jgi:gamma-butyrobetaine dioxygenase